MILIAKNDIRAKECVADLPNYVVDTYTVAHAGKDSELGFCINDESTEALKKIIKPRTFLWSNSINEPIEFLDDYNKTMSRRSSGIWILFHEVNESFNSEIMTHRSRNLQNLKSRLNGVIENSAKTLLWNVVNKVPGKIHLEELDYINNICKYISVWSYSDAGIYFHLYGTFRCLDESLNVQHVDELPCN